MNAVPKIVVLTRSVIWESAIERLLIRDFPHAKLVWALDIEDVLSEVANQTHVAAVIELNIELTPKDVAGDVRQLALHRDRFPAARFFAVGDDWLRGPLLAMRECGFSGGCHSLMRLDRLTNWLKKHFRSLPPADLTIEEQVAERLPWKPVGDSKFQT